jgi:hypothetical protein
LDRTASSDVLTRAVALPTGNGHSANYADDSYARTESRAYNYPENNHRRTENGCAENGHTEDAQRENGHAENDPTENGYTKNGRTKNDPENGHLENDHEENRHQKNGHTEKGQTEKGHETDESHVRSGPEAIWLERPLHGQGLNENSAGDRVLDKQASPPVLVEYQEQTKVHCEHVELGNRRSEPSHKTQQHARLDDSNSCEPAIPPFSLLGPSSPAKQAQGRAHAARLCNVLESQVLDILP